MTETELNLYLMLGLSGFLLNLGYSVLAGLEAISRSRRTAALLFAGVFLAWLGASAAFVLVLQAQGAALFSATGRIVLILYGLVALFSWLGQRRLRRTGRR